MSYDHRTLAGAAAVCEACGGVIHKVAEKYGPQVTMLVQEAQTEASDREITTPRRRGSSPKR